MNADDAAGTMNLTVDILDIVGILTWKGDCRSSLREKDPPQKGHCKRKQLLLVKFRGCWVKWVG